LLQPVLLLHVVVVVEFPPDDHLDLFEKPAICFCPCPALTVKVKVGKNFLFTTCAINLPKNSCSSPPLLYHNVKLLKFEDELAFT
jgi:hypothetical protein